MFGEGGAHFGPESGHDVDDPLGKASVSEGANQVERGKGSILRGFDNAGIAADHGG